MALGDLQIGSDLELRIDDRSAAFSASTDEIRSAAR
jgi:hypothetical protein